MVAGCCIELVPQWFRSAMYGKMFGTGRHFQVIGVVSLQAFYHCDAHFGCQVRILAVSLMSSSPAWVAEDVDVGCPECQSGITLNRISFSDGGIIDGSSLIGNHVCRLL